jgi:hypothetical protein
LTGHTVKIQFTGCRYSSGTVPALLAAGMPAALIYGPMQHRITSPCVGAGRRDWTARLVNGFVNETSHNCSHGVERGVMA